MSASALGRLRSYWTPIAVALVFALVLPFLLASNPAQSFWVGTATDMMILGIFAMGYNFAFGHTGLLSFGHAAFFGTAAYGVAISLDGGAWIIIPALDSFVVAAIYGVVAATVMAAVIGAVCVQRGQIYFAMLTLAFSMMLYTVATQANDVTGGTDGVLVSGSEVDLGVISFGALDAVPYYYFTFTLLVITIIALWRLQNSSYGEILSIIRENPERAEFVGVRVKWYQWSAFVLSGLFAGMAGALASVRSFVVSPDVLFWTTSADPVLMALLGGYSTFLGPLIGAVGYVVLEEAAINFTEHWKIVLGGILVLIVLYQPKGILGAILDKDGSTRANIMNRLRNRGGTETDLDSSVGEREESKDV